MRGITQRKHPLSALQCSFSSSVSATALHLTNNMLDPSDIPLPAFLDPLLDYLADQLPPPLYTFLLKFLSSALAVVTALVSVVASLISTNPSEWNVQTILPPLITFFAAYLALVSLYRTTSWMIRTSLWFIKWGTIFGALTAGAGWYMGTQNGGRGIVTTMGGVLLDMLNGQGQNAAGGTRAPPAARTKTQTQNKRPKAWESFEKHRVWQYEEDAGSAQERNDAQKIMSEIGAAANRILAEGGWWDTAKSMLGGAGTASDEDTRAESRQSRAERRAKSR
ncbi:hypothetical protein BJ138DRAFT_1142257 [Hygrophoropsis aurantiaca]|uniref:Uncharacterized protein n=1 Tax=Hygrophoropsis aurantiaca TaxID=72124 RepID=A0ACB8APP9_9AGAM|nr:hypothetical protein BJ138DRAFT_1142257 [Hygrophoropsis aurantiaca]